MRIAALAVALLLVLSGVVSASATAAGTVSGSPRVEAPGSAVRPQVDGAFDDPRTVMRVRLRDDGAAEWHVEMRYRFDSPNESDAFRSLGEAYASGDADVGVTAELFRQIAARTSEATGRQMQVRNATYDYSVDESAGTGTLTLEFVWTNFLRETEEGNLALGDAFRLPSEESDNPQSWLSLLNEDQRLYIKTPPGYATDTTSIEVLQRNNTIILGGPAAFEGEDALVVTYRKTGITEQGIPWDLVVGGGVVIALLIVLAVVILRWQSGTGTGTGAGGGPPGGPRPTPDAGGGGATNGGVDADRSVEAGDGEADAEGEDADAERNEMDLSLLSDEERVEHLLERNGGRMKQANIVRETGWSDAKVSQLLSAMADEDRVDKLRLGRENLISLPDEGDEE